MLKHPLLESFSPLQCLPENCEILMGISLRFMFSSNFGITNSGVMRSTTVDLKIFHILKMPENLWKIRKIFEKSLKMQRKSETFIFF